MEEWISSERGIVLIVGKWREEIVGWLIAWSSEVCKEKGLWTDWQKSWISLIPNILSFFLLLRTE